MGIAWKRATMQPSGVQRHTLRIIRQSEIRRRLISHLPTTAAVPPTPSKPLYSKILARTAL